MTLIPFTFRTVTIALAFMLGASTAFAGRCAEFRPFVPAALDADLVVQARVVRQARTLVPPSFVEVRVLATLKGRAPAATLTILDSDGALPVQNASAYPVGTTWVFALRPSADGARSYTLPLCANGVLAVIGKNVFGRTSSELDEVLPLSSLHETLRGRR